MNSTRLSTVIFDVDGTLLDSNDAHASVYVEALAKFGHVVLFDQVRPLIGKGGDKVLPDLISVEKDSPEGKRIGDYRSELFKTKYVPNLQPFDGVRELLQRIRRDGLRLVVATSAAEDEADALLERTGAADLFEKRTTSSDASQSKPDPDIVQAALQRTGVRADEAIMVGDTPYDIEAAGTAGVRTIAFRCGGWRDADLRGAVAIYDGPADLLNRYDDSPLATARRA